MLPIVCFPEMQNLVERVPTFFAAAHETRTPLLCIDEHSERLKRLQGERRWREAAGLLKFATAGAVRQAA
jgi:hypothetical protein